MHHPLQRRLTSYRLTTLLSPLIKGHTTAVSDGDNRLYCLSLQYQPHDVVALNPTRRHHPGGVAEAPTTYQSVITHISYSCRRKTFYMPTTVRLRSR
ncbi:MAG: hypothetical protein GPOALKHO_000916 [Sodalis sp.]|nr:MAG: hypothetical protein GPOALKHO_000916 [Sodalis sp.]